MRDATKHRRSEAPLRRKYAGLIDRPPARLLMLTGFPALRTARLICMERYESRI
ncbi:hypothetical protein HY29_00995 [Hyphomonas beringensis]|uniref:Uncharacterized protein n=1 Tax=Hyphomonas beringensis TaxID=1280946 RepID=A0A062UG82_9PROT|nr:hypothetical protein HY29_00995 [Hyphomonas beringensis]